MICECYSGPHNFVSDRWLDIGNKLSVNLCMEWPTRRFPEPIKFGRSQSAKTFIVTSMVITVVQLGSCGADGVRAGPINRIVFELSSMDNNNKIRTDVGAVKIH